MCQEIPRFNQNEVERMLDASALLKTLSHPVRLGILCVIMGQEEINAGRIVEAFQHQCSPSQVAQYLTMLKEKGLVKTRREGQCVYYRLGNPVAAEIIQVLYQHYCQQPTPQEQ